MKPYVLKTPNKVNDLIEKWDDGKKIFVLSGDKPKLAFNPSSSLSMYWGDIDTNKINDFCKINKSSNNLVIGFLSYDYGFYAYGLRPKNKTNLPLAELHAFENWVEEDNGQLVVKYKDESFLDKIIQLSKKSNRQVKKLQLENAFTPSWNLSKYKTAFDKVKDYIKSGDIYQINLSYPLKAKVNASALDIFIQAEQLNQAKMAGLFQGSDFDLISLSPETFINIQKNYIETFPIKGTRARAVNVSDKQVIRSLINDRKEQAELNMISDLLRNDLSVVCNPGSVKIQSRQNTTTLKKVVHTYSHITGIMKENLPPIEALLKMMPGGSISGCPKKRALKIIDEVEDYSRGPYTGVMFSLDPEDNLESSILIRTLVKQEDRISLPVGGGIVFDSNYEAEYQETLDKASSILKAFE